MSKSLNISIDNSLRQKSNTFIERITSDMYFKSDVAGDSLSFEWVDVIEDACIYIDNIIRNPKLALITEDDIVLIEKAKKVSVASVKNLSKNTHYIEKIDAVTNDVQPSKLLIERREETYNTYENRFIYTLIEYTIRFVLKKEKSLEDFTSKSDKTLEYAASTTTGSERVNIELKISTNELPKETDSDVMDDDVASVKNRLKAIKDYFTNWKRSEFMTSLEEARVPFVSSPIKKTNLILKNPNFQVATKLWEYIQTYDFVDKETTKEDLETTGNNLIKGILDDTFLMNYYVLDSIAATQKAQKEKLAKYAVLMIAGQVRRAIELLLQSGVEISDEEILSMISAELKSEKGKTVVSSADIKKKFQKAMDEYFEKTQDYL
ncbi:MAG TPA: DUF2357 domain-containing protein [Mollicutes bacterium]|jgi:uncharacterized protein YnzC (UPF0291/DUF896 family)|nr:DUF2357 domain-containing protein [Mollicutes bacterium]